MTRFTGRVAVVTGAGSGIGRALTLGLARRGCSLALADVNEIGLAETASLAKDIGRDVITNNIDVSDREQVAEFADRVMRHFGRVNQVYNNAGVAFSRSVLDSDYSHYEKVFGVNLWGVIHGTKEFLPHLIASGDGHVVNVSSVNGFMAQADMSHYVTSKFAVRGFTETLRLEMKAGRHPVRVTCVHPGGIRTNIATNAMTFGQSLGVEPTDADVARRDAYNEKILRMTPERAAETILKGVRRNKARILVGSDAIAIDALVRLMPSNYLRAVGPVMDRMTS